MAFDDEIETSFAGYVNAFARRDADALSELWEPVGLFPSPTAISPCRGKRSATIA